MSEPTTQPPADPFDGGAKHARQPVAPAARQVLQLKTLDDFVRLAEVLYKAGIQNKGIDRPAKLIPMLIAGAELGLTIMQSVESITPPVNGRCTLYGDAGLALVRASGLLVKLDEGHDGGGEDRLAWCVTRRAGYPERRYEYTLAQAKKLKSYQSAREKGGPWRDDEDWMLRWRCLWRALRTEFPDVLRGMSGAEEQEEPAAVPTVEVTGVRTSEPLRLAAPRPAEPNAAVTELQLAELARLRGVMELTVGADQVKERWAAAVAAFGVTSAKELTAGLAAELIQRVGTAYDPFTYPPSEPAPAAGSET